MSTYRAVWVICEAPPHADKTYEAPDPRPTVAEARESARGHGWHVTRDGRDICSECWKAGHR